MNNDFKKEFKDALNHEVPDILNKIKSDNRFKVPEKPQKQSIFDIFKSKGVRYVFSSVFVIALLTILFLNSDTDNQVYASTVTMDLNPQIEILLDEDDIVIEVNVLNDDGDVVIDRNIEYRGKTLDEVLEYIVKRLSEENYLIEGEENYMMIYVDGINEQVKERVLARVQEKVNQEAMKYNRLMNFVRTNDYDLTPQEVLRAQRIAEEYNVNPGRAILIIRIRNLTDEYTVLQLSRMKIRDLYALEEQLANPDEPLDDDNDRGNGNSNSNSNM